MGYRRIAEEIFREALRDLDLKDHLARRLQCDAGVVSIDTLRYDLRGFRKVMLLAVGKAALPMAEATLAVLEPHLEPAQTIGGLVVGTSLPESPDPRLQYRLGSHPSPDERSLAAARAALQLLDQAGEGTLLFVLISGGASAMLDLPLDPTISDADVFAFHRALVHSGLSIVDMNILRKHFSAVKGGRLVERAHGATVCTLLISDVPADALDTVGSGPSLPDTSSVADCRALIAAHRDTLNLPPRVLAYFESPALAETPKPGDPIFARSAVVPLLSSEELCRAAAQAAERRGLRSVIDLGCDEWEYGAAVEYLLDRLETLRGQGPVCLISGGEVSVRVPAKHGAGGRNQHFALECARRLAVSGRRVTVLSAGSDGIDGMSPAAGAVADETTFARAAALGLDPQAALDGFDSYPLFQALGDSIVTGPSGNNVRDLRLLLTE